MAILFVTHKFPPSIGGMQKQSYELINGVRKHAKVYTIAINPSENKLWFFLRLKSRIKKMLSEYPDINIVHCNDGVIASLCSWLTDYEHIHTTATFHGLDIVFPNSVFQKSIIPKIQKFSKIFCVSQATADECIKRGFESSKIKVIHNGVDTELKNITTDKTFVTRCKEKFRLDLNRSKVVLAVGRAVKRKGFSWFIKQVLPNLEDVTFVMVGPMANTSSLTHKLLSILPQRIKRQVELMLGYPSDSEEISKLMAQAKNAIHLSDVSFEDLMQLYAHANVFVMPNVKDEGDMEGFGLVALEAVLRKCPVVVSDIEGITDAIIDKENGIRLPSAKALAWTEQINAMLSNSEESKAQADKSLEFTLNNYSWEKMAGEYLNVFNALDAIKTDVSIKDLVLA